MINKILKKIVLLTLVFLVCCMSLVINVYADEESIKLVKNNEKAVLELRRKRTEIFRTTYLQEKFEELLVSEPEVKTRVERVYDVDQDQKMQEVEGGE